MAFPEDIVRTRFDIVDSKCQRCGKKLAWEDRGPAGVGTWQAHHIDENTHNNSITNCKILCWPCHEKTF